MSANGTQTTQELDAPTLTREQLLTLIADAEREGYRENRALDERNIALQAELQQLQEQQQAIEVRRKEIQQAAQQSNASYSARELPRRGQIDAWRQALGEAQP